MRRTRWNLQASDQLAAAERTAFVREQDTGFQPVQQLPEHFVNAGGKGGEKLGLILHQARKVGDANRLKLEVLQLAWMDLSVFFSLSVSHRVGGISGRAPVAQGTVNHQELPRCGSIRLRLVWTHICSCKELSLDLSFSDRIFRSGRGQSPSALQGLAKAPAA